MKWKEIRGKLLENLGVVLTKFLTLLLFVVLGYLTCYQISAMIYHFYLMIRYENSLIIIVMIINENIRNERIS